MFLLEAFEGFIFVNGNLDLGLAGGAAALGVGLALADVPFLDEVVDETLEINGHEGLVERHVHELPVIGEPRFELPQR